MLSKLQIDSTAGHHDDESHLYEPSLRNDPDAADGDGRLIGPAMMTFSPGNGPNIFRTLKSVGKYENTYNLCNSMCFLNGTVLDMQ